MSVNRVVIALLIAFGIFTAPILGGMLALLLAASVEKASRGSLWPTRAIT
jgi:hypothetical protein